MKGPTSARQAGMTLVELLVVVVVIALLSSIAIPSYRAYTLRINRSEAKVELTSLAQRLERCYTRTNRYDDASCTLTGMPMTLSSGRYVLDVVFGEDGQSYVLTATPQGPQARDTDCGELTLDQLGRRGRSGSKPLEQCWQR